MADKVRLLSNENPLYGPEDCSCTGYGMFLAGRVAVLKPEALPEGAGQLVFCTGGAGSDPNAVDCLVRAVSLSNGKCVSKKRNEILGLLKPELLPDDARLRLSQIRPLNSKVPEAPEYFGYCFLPNGRYAAGVPLSDGLEAWEYINVQKDYQHRMMVCDREDCCVFELQEGRLLYPTQEILDEYRDMQEKQQGFQMSL